MSLDQTLKFLRRRLIVRPLDHGGWPGRDKREVNLLGKRLARLVGIVKGESTRVYMLRDDIGLGYGMDSTKTKSDEDAGFCIISSAETRQLENRFTCRHGVN